MRDVRFTVTSILTLAAFAACVGDNPESGDDDGPGDAGRSESDAATPPAERDGASGPDGSDEPDGAALACEGGTTACSGACVDLGTAAAHCGACGHDCGGGECVAGSCQPFTVVDGLTQLHDVGVDDTHVYFTDDNLVERCAKDAPCAGSARQVLADFSGLNEDGTGALAVAAGVISFYGNTAGDARWYVCPVTGCPSPLTSLRGSQSGFGSLVYGGGAFYAYVESVGVVSTTCSGSTCGDDSVRTDDSFSRSPLAANGSHYFFTERDGTNLIGIGRCAANEATCAYGTNLTQVSTLTTARKLIATDSKLFVFWPGGQGGGSALGVCALDGCPDQGSPTVVRDSISTWADVAAYGNDAFWVDEKGDLKTCASDACAAPRTLAVGLANVSRLGATNDFLYWVENAGSPTPNGAVRRLAR